MYACCIQLNVIVIVAGVFKIEILLDRSYNMSDLIKENTVSWFILYSRQIN